MIVDAAKILGAVVIGRNEGDRLRQCLMSLDGRSMAAVVYVDSGSTDGSADMASGLGVDVVHLDMSTPFTAARARNEGFERLMALQPSLKYVQFVDGDCEVVAGWLECAVAFLEAEPDYAVVCGRRRERFPDRSVYNRLCDREWNTPGGDPLSCGGDAMMRTDAFRHVGGYNNHVIAGEEPELCLRLRRTGRKIRRLDEEMTLHDAAMTRLGQWWTRQVRSGHAYAEGAWMYGGGPERHWVKETARALGWGLVLPLFIVCLALLTSPWVLTFLGVYPLQLVRLWSKSGSLANAVFSLLGRFAETVGVLKFHHSRWRGGPRRIIEYK